MSENLPQNYKENVFQKFWRKLKAFFNKNKVIEENEPERADTTQIKNNESNFLNQIKVEEASLSNDYEKKQFMQKLTENPDLLENFSVARLEKILEYYKNENEQKRQILKNYGY